MSMIRVELNQTDFSHILSCLSALKAAAIDLQKSIPEESAREFSLLLKKNLLEETFASTYPPLGTWKKGEPNENKFWLWTGKALASIDFRKIRESAWYAGFTNKAVNVAETTSGEAKKVPISSTPSTKPTIKRSSAFRKYLIEQSVARHREKMAATVSVPEHLKHLIGKKVGSDFTTTSVEKREKEK